MELPKDVVFRSREQYRAAQIALKLLHTHPKSVAAFHNVAVLILNGSSGIPNALAATKYLRCALRLDKNHTPSLVDIGVALLRLGKYRAAELVSKKALEIDECLSTAHVTLTASLSGQNKFTDAMKHAQLALFYDSESASAHRNLAALFRSQGESRAAVKHYKRVMQLDPYDMNNYSLLEVSLISIGNQEEAIEVSKRKRIIAQQILWQSRQ